MQIVTTAADLRVGDRILDENSPAITSVTVLENGRIQFSVEPGAYYTLDAEGIMEVWR